MEAWRKRGRIASSATFRRRRGGGAREGRLTPKGGWTILRKLAEQAGRARGRAAVAARAARRSHHRGLSAAYLRGARDEQVIHHARQKRLAIPRPIAAAPKSPNTARRGCSICDQHQHAGSARDPPGPTAPDPVMTPQTTWPRTTLRVVGAGVVDRFRAAAGSGDPLDARPRPPGGGFFLPMAAPVDGDAPVEGARAISVPGTRILARRLGDAVDHQRALTRRLTDHSCPLDLHRLLPVPEPILRLGPDEPVAQAWLRSHRGTPRPLRHVRALPALGDRRRRQTSQMRVEFWSADWSPWQALRRLRQAWPML